MAKFSRRAILIATAFMFAGCSTNTALKQQLGPFSKADVPPAPNYADPASWLSKPDDPDRFAVDIIWVYPTVLFDNSAWLMNISRKDLIAGAAESVASEARVFSGQANLMLRSTAK